MKIFILQKHTLAIRWMHWFNFPILTIMIWSGMLIYWANGEYSFGIGDYEIFKFFPVWFYKFLKVPYRLSEGMAYHFVFMWLFFINGFLYVLYTIFSGEWRYLVPQKKSFAESWDVIKYDFGLSKNLPMQSKYNAAQRIAYFFIIVMGFGSIITGLAIYKPVQLQWITDILGGYKAARLEHFILTIGYVLFFFIHLAQVIRAGWSNFRSMIIGFEIEKKRKE